MTIADWKRSGAPASMFQLAWQLRGKFNRQFDKTNSARENLEERPSELEESDSMTIVPVQEIPRLHTTPLASIRVKDAQVVADVDDERENRISLVFHPYQAMQMITADCYALPGDVALLPNTVMEVLHSSWISELRARLRQVDETATFMDNARHFIVPLQDDFLEVVAWNIMICEPIEQEKTR